MKLINAINKLKKNGWEIQDSKGSYIASKEDVTIRFFVNHGSDNCSSFAYDSDLQCAPTYGLSLKKAMSY